MSSSESSNVQESDSSDEMEVVGLIEPNADEPPSHSSDDEEVGWALTSSSSRKI